MHSSWETPRSNQRKYFLLTEVLAGDNGFADIKPLILGHYIRLLRREETEVKLPCLFTLACYATESKPLGQFIVSDRMLAFLLEKGSGYQAMLVEDLDFRLLYDTVATRRCLTDLMIQLFSRGQREDAAFLQARDKLLAAAIYFEYGEVLWLYAHKLADPQRPNVTIVTKNKRVTRVLVNYLYQCEGPEFQIDTSRARYELRTGSLFRCVITLLLREQDYKTAAALCHHVQHACGLEDPWFHLQETKKNLSTEYSALLLEFVKVSDENTYRDLTGP